MSEKKRTVVIFGRPMAGKSIFQLINESSFGTDEVMEIRARTPQHVADSIVERAMSEAPGYHKDTPRWCGSWRTRGSRKLAQCLFAIELMEGF